MKILQRIEFWVFALPALVVAIGGIAHYGAWRALWVFPVGYTLASVTQFCKSMVYEVVDAPRTNACRSGKWCKAFGLVMLVPLYNWFVAAAFVDCLWRNRSDLLRHEGPLLTFRQALGKNLTGLPKVSHDLR